MVEKANVVEECSSCVRLKQEIEIARKDQASTLKMIKEKIMSTDKLIKKYQKKCDDFDKQAKLLNDITTKHESCKRNAEILQEQLDHALQVTEPQTKNIRRLIQEKFKAEERIQEMKQKNTDLENVINQLKHALELRDEKDSTWKLEQQVQAKLILKERKRTDKLEKDLEKAKDDTKKEKALVKEKNRELRKVVGKCEKLELQLKDMKEKLKLGNQRDFYQTRTKLSSKEGTRITRTRKSRKRCEEMPVEPMSHSDEELTSLSDEQPSLMSIFDEMNKYSLHTPLSPLPPSPIDEENIPDFKDSSSGSSDNGSSSASSSDDDDDDDKALEDLGEMLETELGCKDATNEEAAVDDSLSLSMEEAVYFKSDSSGGEDKREAKVLIVTNNDTSTNNLDQVIHENSKSEDMLVNMETEERISVENEQHGKENSENDKIRVTEESEFKVEKSLHMKSIGSSETPSEVSTCDVKTKMSDNTSVVTSETPSEVSTCGVRSKMNDTTYVTVSETPSKVSTCDVRAKMNGTTSVTTNETPSEVSTCDVRATMNGSTSVTTNEKKLALVMLDVEVSTCDVRATMNGSTSVAVSDTPSEVSTCDAKAKMNGTTSVTTNEKPSEVSTCDVRATMNGSTSVAVSDTPLEVSTCDAKAKMNGTTSVTTNEKPSEVSTCDVRATTNDTTCVAVSETPSEVSTCDAKAKMNGTTSVTTNEKPSEVSTCNVRDKMNDTTSVTTNEILSEVSTCDVKATMNGTTSVTTNETPSEVSTCDVRATMNGSTSVAVSDTPSEVSTCDAKAKMNGTTSVTTNEKPSEVSTCDVRATTNDTTCVAVSETPSEVSTCDAKAKMNGTTSVTTNEKPSEVSTCNVRDKMNDTTSVTTNEILSEVSTCDVKATMNDTASVTTNETPSEVSTCDVKATMNDTASVTTNETPSEVSTCDVKATMNDTASVTTNETPSEVSTCDVMENDTKTVSENFPQKSKIHNHSASEAQGANIKIKDKSCDENKNIVDTLASIDNIRTYNNCASHNKSDTKDVLLTPDDDQLVGVTELTPIADDDKTNPLVKLDTGVENIQYTEDEKMLLADEKYTFNDNECVKQSGELDVNIEKKNTDDDSSEHLNVPVAKLKNDQKCKHGRQTYSSDVTNDKLPNKTKRMVKDSLEKSEELQENTASAKLEKYKFEKKSEGTNNLVNEESSLLETDLDSSSDVDTEFCKDKTQQSQNKEMFSDNFDKVVNEEQLPEKISKSNLSAGSQGSKDIPYETILYSEPSFTKRRIAHRPKKECVTLNPSCTDNHSSKLNEDNSLVEIDTTKHNPNSTEIRNTSAKKSIQDENKQTSEIFTDSNNVFSRTCEKDEVVNRKRRKTKRSSTELSNIDKIKRQKRVGVVSTDNVAPIRVTGWRAKLKSKSKELTCEETDKKSNSIELTERGINEDSNYNTDSNKSRIISCTNEEKLKMNDDSLTSLTPDNKGSSSKDHSLKCHFDSVDNSSKEVLCNYESMVLEASSCETGDNNGQSYASSSNIFNVKNDELQFFDSSTSKSTEEIIDEGKTGELDEAVDLRISLVQNSLDFTKEDNLIVNSPKECIISAQISETIKDNVNDVTVGNTKPEQDLLTIVTQVGLDSASECILETPDLESEGFKTLDFFEELTKDGLNVSTLIDTNKNGLMVSDAISSPLRSASNKKTCFEDDTLETPGSSSAEQIKTLSKSDNLQSKSPSISIDSPSFISSAIEDYLSVFDEKMPLLSPLPPSPSPSEASPTHELDTEPEFSQPSSTTPSTPSFASSTNLLGDRKSGGSEMSLLPTLRQSSLFAKGNRISSVEKRKANCDEHETTWKLETTESKQAEDVSLSKTNEAASSKRKKNKDNKTISVRPAFISEIKYASKVLKFLTLGDVKMEDVIDRLSSLKNLSNTTPLAAALAKFQHNEDLMPNIIQRYHDRDRQNFKQMDKMAHLNKWNPVLSVFEERVLEMVTRLSEVEHLKGLSTKIVSLLSRSIVYSCSIAAQDEPDKRSVASSCRVLCALCRKESDLQRMRVLCYDIIRTLYSRPGTVLYLMISIAAVWPTVLSSTTQAWTTAKGLVCLSGGTYQPLTCAVQMILTTWVRTNDWVLLGNVIDWLCVWKQAPPGVFLLQHLAGELVRLMRDPSFACLMVGKDGNPILGFGLYEVVKSLELVTCVLGWAWLNNVLVRGIIWDILASWAITTRPVTGNTANNVSLKDADGNNDHDGGCEDACSTDKALPGSSQTTSSNTSKVGSDTTNCDGSATYCEATVVATIRLLGLVCRIAIQQHQTSIPQVLPLLIGILERAKDYAVPYAVQLSTVYSLLEVSPWQPSQVVSVLENWKASQDSNTILPESFIQGLDCLKMCLQSNRPVVPHHGQNDSKKDKLDNDVLLL